VVVGFTTTCAISAFTNKTAYNITEKLLKVALTP
jgi:hypothetical protein